jgi:protein PET100
MGNWQLEVGKMAIYMAFPVITFYTYHQTEWFEDRYKEMKQKMHTPATVAAEKEFKEFTAAMQALQEKKRLKKLKEMSQQNSTTDNPDSSN